MRCTDASGYRCPRLTYGVMVVAAFADNTVVRYRSPMPCETDCETECVRRADCVGFTSSLILLGTGGLTATASARCGPAAVPCPTVQMQFSLPTPCDEAAPETLVVEPAGAIVSAALANCTITVSARALRSDASFSVPHIAAARSTHGRGSLAILLGLTGAASVVALGSYVWFRLF